MINTIFKLMDLSDFRLKNELGYIDKEFYSIQEVIDHGISMNKVIMYVLIYIFSTDSQLAFIQLRGGIT